MSHLTDRARAGAAKSPSVNDAPIPGQMFDEVLQHLPLQRRGVLKAGFAATLAGVFGGGLLAGCGTTSSSPDYSVRFSALAKNTDDTVSVPAGYTAEVLFAAGDAVTAGATAFAGSFLTSAETEQLAGGNHDGMQFYALDGVDPNAGGLLAINHEFPDFAILQAGDFDAATATPEHKRAALSAVGVSVIEVELRRDGKWAVKADSPYNRRYSGNTSFRVSGPAASVVGATVVGTLNNCSSGATPWGTYLTCEESTDNYLDPTQGANGYGWVVEIDPYGSLPQLPVKRTALGRCDHENAACLLAADGRVAVYLGDDSTPGCIYKFVPGAKVDAVPGNSGAAGVSNVQAFGHNAMYSVDPATKTSKRFLVGPAGCEITGLTWTPDLKTFFVNIQHPTGNWPSNAQGNTLPPRSATVVVRRTDGQPVGA